MRLDGQVLLSYHHLSLAAACLTALVLRMDGLTREQSQSRRSVFVGHVCLPILRIPREQLLRTE